MRTAIVVDREKLIAALTKAEVGGALSNESHLWKAAADIYNADNPPASISFSIVMLRAREWKLELRTKPGKRGPGVMSDEHKAALLAGRKKALDEKRGGEPAPQVAHKASVQRYIIHLDENGKEISRALKGRGRPPTETDADGNYIVRPKINIPPKPSKPRVEKAAEPALQKPQVVVDEKEYPPLDDGKAESAPEVISTDGEEIITRRQKIVEVDKIIPEYVELACTRNLKVVRKDYEIEIYDPVILPLCSGGKPFDLGIDDLIPNAVYPKIVIVTKPPREVRIFRNYNTDRPDIIVRERTRTIGCWDTTE